MIIAISGKTASGKDTVAKLLSKKTGFKLLSFSFKDFLKEKYSKEVLEFERRLDLNFDKEFDSWVKKEVLKYKDQNLIVVSRLSAINLLDIADLKIFLYASDDERAKRLAKRENLSLKEAKKLLEERDKVFEERIKKVYGIKYDDPIHYDIIINTTDKDPKEVVDIIACLVSNKKI